MVGGTVIEVAFVDDRVFVDCADYREGCKHPDTCAIYVERNSTSEQIQIGDLLWWQGEYAYWGPDDIPIRRRGYSGVKLER